MALGRDRQVTLLIPGGPPRARQQINRVLWAERQRQVYSQRAADVIVIPKRSRTYFGRFLPARAPRVAPFDWNYTGVRDTLVARSRFFASVAQKQAGS